MAICGDSLRLQKIPATRGELKQSFADYQSRLTSEIGMIKQMGFAGYFLIVWDFVRYAKEHSIPVGPGRGSAAGSLVAYCLEITDIERDLSCVRCNRDRAHDGSGDRGQPAPQGAQCGVRPGKRRWKDNDRRGRRQ